MSTIHIDCFEVCADLKGRRCTYAAIRERVLEQGRFSVFDAMDTTTKAALFSRLMRDPELETWDMGFPWTGVRRKEVGK